MKKTALLLFIVAFLCFLSSDLLAETTALSEYLNNGSTTSTNSTSNASAAKEGFLTLIFGAVYVLCLTMPFYLGIGKAMSVYGNNGGEGKYSSSSILKFLAIPFMAHLLAVILAVMFANIWDAFYTEFPSIRLIKAFFETTAGGEGTNAWVKAANASVELAGMVTYYLIISAPLVVFVCVVIVSNVMISSLKSSGENRGAGHLKNNVLIISLMLLMSGALTTFYQMTLDKAMFQGQAITFKTYGEASSANQMSVNFFKKIARFGASGQIVQ